MIRRSSRIGSIFVRPAWGDRNRRSRAGSGRGRSHGDFPRAGRDHRSVRPSPRAAARSNLAAVHWLVKLPIAAVLVGVTYFLLPSSVGYPPASPATSGALDRQSVVTLVTAPWGGDGYSAQLNWYWDVGADKSQASLFIVIHSQRARTSLIFGGPISSRADCAVNGETTTAAPGLPVDLGYAMPTVVRFWLEDRTPGSVNHLDFKGDAGPGGLVIHCSFKGFAADDPPLHRLYTPELNAYAHGAESASNEDLEREDVCVSVNGPEPARRSEACATRYQPVAELGQSEDLINLPGEQGKRDAHLVLIGAVAGTAAALVADLLTETLQALVFLNRRHRVGPRRRR